MYLDTAEDFTRFPFEMCQFETRFGCAPDTVLYIPT